MTQALNPKVQEIKEKYADNKDLQNQMTALLYQETKVSLPTHQIRRSVELTLSFSAVKFYLVIDYHNFNHHFVSYCTNVVSEHILCT